MSNATPVKHLLIFTVIIVSIASYVFYGAAGGITKATIYKNRIAAFEQFKEEMIKDGCTLVSETFVIDRPYPKEVVFDCNGATKKMIR